MLFLIADDHPIFRSGLKALLHNAFPKAEILEFDNGIDAQQGILDNTPDFSLLDIDMPGKNGLDVCSAVRDQTSSKLIILTMYNDGEMLKKALDSGANAYLVKDNTSEELVECIESLKRGESYIAKSMRKSPKVQKELKYYNEVTNKLKELTEAEFKTLALVSEKYSSKEIAELLFISSKSVENYRSRICKKLNIDTSKKRLIVWAIENKNIIDEMEK
ncbi:MAG TPA: response regulator transcription factor [Brumimicrobium sp.]|nr:response regulator transcription factor [Brumimicrobium sp.]